MIAHALHILAALPLGLAVFLTMRLAGVKCFERHKLWLTLPEHGRFWPRMLREIPYDPCLPIHAAPRRKTLTL